MSRIILVLSIIGALSAADKLLIPMDPQQYKQLSESVLQAARDGDDAAVLVGGRHALELAPNDPELQAPIYLLMSFAARNSGEATLAEEYAAIARTLDPSIESRMKNSGPATRGDTAGTIQNAANIFGAAFNSYEQIKMMKLCLDMVKHGMAPPPQCSGQAAGQAPIAGMPPPMPTQPGMPAMPPPMPMPTQPGMPAMPPPMPPPMPMQSGANVVYPPAPVGSPVYQAPLAPPAPMPGWPVPGDPSLTQAMQVPPPMPPPAQTAPLPPMTQAGPAPGMPPQPASPPQAPVPPQYPQGGRAQTSSRGGYSFAPPAAPGGPYANTRYAPRSARTRGGDEPAVYRVIHDHSNIGNKAYFEQSCGGLLAVSGTNLTFTGSGGEEPRVIPAADILEIRLNSVIGKDAGVFHIATRQGLYLSLAPESQDREQARALIEAIRTSLNLNE